MVTVTSTCPSGVRGVLRGDKEADRLGAHSPEDTVEQLRPTGEHAAGRGSNV